MQHSPVLLWNSMCLPSPARCTFYNCAWRQVAAVYIKSRTRLGTVSSRSIENNAPFLSLAQAPPPFSKLLNYLQRFKRTSVLLEECLHCHAFQTQAELYNQSPPQRQELCCTVKICTGSTLHYHTRLLCIPAGNLLLPPKISRSLPDFLNFTECLQAS